jgi:hypothetical protein
MTRTVMTAIRALTPCAGVWRLQNRSPGLSVRSDSRIASRHGVSFCQQQRLRACTRVTRPGLAEPRRAARPRLDDSETRLKRATSDSAPRRLGPFPGQRAGLPESQRRNYTACPKRAQSRRHTGTGRPEDLTSEVLGHSAAPHASTCMSESCPSQGSSRGLEVKRRTAGRPA